MVRVRRIDILNQTLEIDFKFRSGQSAPRLPTGAPSGLSRSGINLSKSHNIDLRKASRPATNRGFFLRFKPPSEGLVPVGDTGLYITPDEPADPTDCDRWPDSPYCGGNPLSLAPVSFEPSIAIDGCNIGIRFDGSIGFIKVPPISLVYRKPECRIKKKASKVDEQDSTICFLNPYPLAQGIKVELSVTLFNASQSSAIKSYPVSSKYGSASLEGTFSLNLPDFRGDKLCFRLLFISDVDRFIKGGSDPKNELGVQRTYFEDTSDEYDFRPTYRIYLSLDNLNFNSFFQSNPNFTEFRANLALITKEAFRDLRVTIKPYNLQPVPPPKEKCCMPQCCPPPDDSLLKALMKKVNELDKKLGQFPQLASVQNEEGETIAKPIESVSLGLKVALEQIKSIPESLAQKVNEIHERVGEFPQELELEGEEPKEVKSIAESIKLTSERIELINKTIGIAEFPQELELEGEDSPKEVKSIAESVKLASERVELINKTIGVNEFPASVPESFISRNEGFIGNLIPNPNKEIKNLSQLFVWYVERWDEVMGQFEIAIKLKDADPTKPGDQPLGLKLPNLAETLAEMVLLLLQTSINSETLLNITTRSLAESGQIKQQAFKIYNQAEALLDYFNFENKQVIQKMPLSFKPGEEKFEDMLQDTELDVAVTEFSDKNDFTDDMYDLKQAAAVIRAQNFRRVPMGDAATMTAFLKDMIRGFGATSDAVSKQEKDENGKDDFDRRLEDIELGFTNKTGITDATHPYGRDFEERPRIKRLEDTSSQGGTS